MDCEQSGRAHLACSRHWRAHAPGVLTPLAYPVPPRLRTMGGTLIPALGTDLAWHTSVCPPLSMGEELKCAQARFTRRCRTYAEAGAPLVFGMAFEHHVAVGDVYAFGA